MKRRKGRSGRRREPVRKDKEIEKTEKIVGEEEGKEKHKGRKVREQ